MTTLRNTPFPVYSAFMTNAETSTGSVDIADIADVATQIAPVVAQSALAEVMAVLGSAPRWSYDVLEAVTDIVKRVQVNGLPRIDDPAALQFWEQLA